MDRRETIKTLALGSLGLAAPMMSWSRIPKDEATSGPRPDEHATCTNGLSPLSEYHPGLHLVADSEWLDRFAGMLPDYVKKTSRAALNPEELIKSLAQGDGLIWIGNPEGVPRELSVGAFRPSEMDLDLQPISGSPLAVDKLTFSASRVHSAFIAPPKEMPNHNIDEEVRADFLPVLQAVDKFGNTVGYPAVVMSYYAPSLALARFRGSECFFFFLEKPVEALDVTGWKNILGNIVRRREGGLQVTAFATNYASYHPGERAQISTRIRNNRPEAVSVICRYSVKGPNDREFRPITDMRRVPEGGSDTVAVCDFRPGAQNGMWTIRVEILQDVEQAELLSVVGNPVLIDRRELGFMVLGQPLKTPPIISFRGPSILIDGKEGFWAGTHYYPSTSWWEWVWREFQPLKAAEDLAAIRKAGYRIVRVWVDPVIDEPVLRAMDVAIHLAAQNGIVLDICIFTQWARKMGFERASGEQVLFDYRGPRDFNIISFSLRNLNLQREFVTVLASRWKNAGNIMYNLANEVYMRDPDPSEMDKEVLTWKGIPTERGTVRDTLLFRQWAREMTNAIRKAGANQATMPGYMFSTMNGGDFYLANQDAPVLPWHCYLGPEQTGLTVQYFDPIAVSKPLLLEEFGYGKWNHEKNYDGNAHYALGAGAAGAMSYEWGISWLARESCYWPLPLREASLDRSPDPRWFPPYLDLGKTWDERGVGLCPTPSGTGYGSIYHGTVFPAAAALALGRLGIMGGGLQRVQSREHVYVVIPAAQLQGLDPVRTTLAALWSVKAIFGIWQESSLSNLPESAKAIICPYPLSPASEMAVQSLRARGVKVYTGVDGWTSCSMLEKVSVTPGEQIDLLSRRTVKGQLFTLAARKPEKQVTVKYGRLSATVDVNDFGIVHMRTEGISLLEGTGQIKVNDQVLCTVEGERLIIGTDDDKDLLQAQKMKLLVTGPARIHFKRTIKAISISDGAGSGPVRVKQDGIPGQVLMVDDQLAKYIIHISF